MSSGTCLGRFGSAKVPEMGAYFEPKTTPKRQWIDFQSEKGDSEFDLQSTYDFEENSGVECPKFMIFEA